MPFTPASTEAYTGLITSEHNVRPLFMDLVSALTQPLADGIELVATLPGLYDVDDAVGAQLDADGLWVGRTRMLKVPLTEVYFSFDISGLGFDEGAWFGPFDPTTGLVRLPDENFRTLIRAAIAADRWDGTIPGAYDVWDIVFAGTGISILIQDHQDMSMDFAMIGPVPDAITKGLLAFGLLTLKPSAVRVKTYYTPTVPGNPLFAFDCDSTSLAGFDVGAWAEILAPL